MYVVLEVFPTHGRFISDFQPVPHGCRSGVRFFQSLEEAIQFASRHGASERECSGRCLAEFYFSGSPSHSERQSTVFPVEEGVEMQGSEIGIFAEWRD